MEREKDGLSDFLFGLLAGAARAERDGKVSQLEGIARDFDENLKAEQPPEYRRKIDVDPWRDYRMVRGGPHRWEYEPGENPYERNK